MTLADAARSRAGCAVAVTAVVFAASFIGIDSRLPGSLAVLWPANAALLAIFIRFPRSRRRPEVWIAAAIGYVAADVSHGTELGVALVLATANMSGVLVALVVLGRLNALNLRTATPSYALRVASGCVAGCAVGALIGATVTVQFFGGTFRDGWLSWLASDLVNYALLLPVLLALGRWHRPSARGLLRTAQAFALPWVLLIALLAVAGVLRDSGSVVAFTMPALVAGALGGRMLGTALMVMTSTAAMLALSVGVEDSAAPAPVSTTTQLALALLALGPLVVAAATAERRRLLDELREATTRDDLTGVLRRGEFSLRAQELLDESRRTGAPLAFLMMDLDHFKLLNDRHGHRAGDQALVGFSAVLEEVLTSTDSDTDSDTRGRRVVVGRIGGEEFAALLSGTTPEQACSLAEEIRRRQEELARSGFGVDGSTVSIGVAHGSGHDDVDDLMLSADAAVYSAKRRGRNGVVVADDSLARAVGE